MKFAQFFGEDELNEDAPEWLHMAVIDAHEDSEEQIPWVYETCRAAAQAIDDGKLDLAKEHNWEKIEAFIDEQMDYEHLFLWADEMQGTSIFIGAEHETKDEHSHCEECGNENTTIAMRIMSVQHMVLALNALGMIDACRLQGEEDEDEDEDDEVKSNVVKSKSNAHLN